MEQLSLSSSSADKLMDEKQEKKMKWVEAHQLPEGERVYLKKDFIGWRVIEPWKNEDGSINKFNLLLGGKRNLFILGFVMILAVLIYLGFNEAIANYKMIAEAPCDFCLSCSQASSSVFNLSNFTVLGGLR